MSWYINYYLGYKKDGKIYPLGAIDDKGEIHTIFYRSRVSKLKEEYDFIPVEKEMWSDELHEKFEYYKPEEGSPYTEYDAIYYLPVSELGSTDYIKTGYFLNDDIFEYLNSEYKYDYEFYNPLSPTEYSLRMQSEILKDRPLEPMKDFDGEDLAQDCTIFDYSYFSYPDYNSAEYEAHVIKLFADAYEFVNFSKDDRELVVLKTEG